MIIIVIIIVIIIILMNDLVQSLEKKQRSLRRQAMKSFNFMRMYSGGSEKIFFLKNPCMACSIINDMPRYIQKFSDTPTLLIL